MNSIYPLKFNIYNTKWEGQDVVYTLAREAIYYIDLSKILTLSNYDDYKIGIYFQLFEEEILYPKYGYPETIKLEENQEVFLRLIHEWSRYKNEL